MVKEMTSPPAVSVIIIFLNAERFIREAIDSVFAQSHSEWELLLVDDGSTDASTDIALDYAARHAGRVRYLQHQSHENRGMSASRNLGIKAASGRFIAFLDADDVWLPQKLERQVEMMRRQPDAAMVYGLTSYWYGWTGSSDDSQKDFVADLGIAPGTLVRPPTLLTLLLRSEAPTPCPSDILLRREILDRAGLFEENFRGLFEDQVFLSKVYVTAPVFVAGECWFKYRQHADSCDSVMAEAGKKHAAGLIFFDWLEDYLVTRGITDVEIWQALKAKRWRYSHPTLHRLSTHARRSIKVLGESSKSAARRVLPVPIHRWLRARFNNYR
ncbi:MAG TPA: glycosyltransferase family A protein [Blastocatellia bacterium]|jgi:glycosyltransferase involved in cell wall biosynthesis|nr:glycosyltransferase family A protein [Blastocatellia bacterium]